MKRKKRSQSPRKASIAIDSNPRSRPNSHSEEEKEEMRATTSIIWDKYPILSSDFYQIDALDLAPRLLGKYLKRDDVVLQITEVEAYRQKDSACHGRFGITASARTAPVTFEAEPESVDYLSWIQDLLSSNLSEGLLSMQHEFRGHGNCKICGIITSLDREGMLMFTFVTVFIQCLMWWLIRKELVQQSSFVLVLQSADWKPFSSDLKSEKPVLLAGPGKVGQALGISTEWSNHPLFRPGGLELLDGPEPENILVGPRVGIEYASAEHVSALWRFAIADSPWISAPKKTLRPP